MSTSTSTRPRPQTPPRTSRLRPAGPPRRRRWIAILVALGVVVSLAAGFWLVWFSTVLAAERVTVTGVVELTTDQVQTAAAVPLGRPLARQDLGAIARRTAQLPQVESARVTRHWPNTVAVAVVERRPLIAVQQPDGFLMIDHLGVAYETRPAVPAGVVLAQVNPDRPELLTQVGRVAVALAPELRNQVASVSATSDDDIALLLHSGLQVSWGSSAESDLKSSVVVALLRRQPRHSIDVTSPHQPAVR